MQIPAGTVVNGLPIPPGVSWEDLSAALPTEVLTPPPSAPLDSFIPAGASSTQVVNGIPLPPGASWEDLSAALPAEVIGTRPHASEGSPGGQPARWARPENPLRALLVQSLRLLSRLFGLLGRIF